MLAALVVVLASSGCGESITEVEFPDADPRLTVNSYFTADSTWRVYVSETRSQGDLPQENALGAQRTLPAVTDATVELLRDGRLVDTLQRIPPQTTSSALAERFDGLYGSAQTPTRGATYTLRVSAPGFETARAENTVPAPVTVREAVYRDSVWVETDESSARESRPVGQFSFRFNDPAGVDNYYRVVLYAIENCYFRYFQPIPFDINAEVNRDIFADPTTVTGDWLEDFPLRGRVVFTDASFDGKEYNLTVSFPTRGSIRDDGYVAILSAISKEYYDYAYSVRVQEATEKNPFAEPVGIRSNVEGGYGVVAGYLPVAAPRATIGEVAEPCTW